MTMARQPSREESRYHWAPPTAIRQRDPVCGMTVDPVAAEHRAVHAGHEYYFCSSRCHQKFEADPARYLGCAVAPDAPADAGEGMWTCPMHPEVQRSGPGSCPICGMALEPMSQAAGEVANPELRDMLQRFWVCLGLSIPLLVLAMGEHFGGAGLLAPRTAIWMQLVLATPAVLWGGWPFFQRGWASVFNLRLNMFTLIALGTGVAYAYSLVAALAPALFPASFRTAGGEVPVYFEPAAVIVTLVLLGQVLELRARAQ